MGASSGAFYHRLFTGSHKNVQKSFGNISKVQKVEEKQIPGPESVKLNQPLLSKKAEQKNEAKENSEWKSLSSNLIQFGLIWQQHHTGSVLLWARFTGRFDLTVGSFVQTKPGCNTGQRHCWCNVNQWCSGDICCKVEVQRDSTVGQRGSKQISLLIYCE